jgi:hypothetical protein
MGETCVYLANILGSEDQEEEANKLYEKATSCFRKCQSIDADALPDTFVDLMEQIDQE